MNVKTLHLFNPEHDIALATNLTNFTAPHAARQLADDLGFLPALWAADGDGVLVSDEDYARKALRRFRRGSHMQVAEPLWVMPHTLATTDVEAIEPWGWDAALRSRLARYGARQALLPSLDMLDEVRLLSHRDTARRLLSALRMEGTVGESFLCTTEEAVEAVRRDYSHIVLKAPWSSSGRGIRFVSGPLSDHQRGWLANLLCQQGAVMAEPYYNKVKDFGMEFEADGRGGVRYLGLSLFHTTNGAYTGNVLATEAEKRRMLGRYISLDLLDAVCQRIVDNIRLGSYHGPFGIDMMVVNGTTDNVQSSMFKVQSSKSNVLHPCVELNLRRTMGHVALALSPDDDDLRKVMRIHFDGTIYRLRINKLR